ncbi:MAG TPA: hypothetical protein VLL76_10790, partial [Candidatus Omnitrophota bacterium]|nr:hypothetical protein [Candidatus Omnitrophota bacterium]
MALVPRSAAIALALLLTAGPSAARDELGPYGQLPGGAAASPSEAPPLMEGLGNRSFPIATSDPRAQAYFDQGLRWSYGFNHGEAARAFRAAQRLDPACALCAWGEALVLGPNINKPMDPADLPTARAALDRARALAATAPPKEQALIAALSQRYGEDGPRDAAYAEAMADVARRFPDDHDIQALTAEAMMDTQPWDYWEADKTTPKGYTEAVVATLERVLRADPDHPGAIHLYIHTVEASATPERALPYAQRLAAQMPAAGH